jgi:hypothetical protein
MHVRVRDGDRGGQVSSAPDLARDLDHALELAPLLVRVRLLPWCVLEKPHCGDRQRFSRGTNLAALRCVS